MWTARSRQSATTIVATSRRLARNGRSAIREQKRYASNRPRVESQSGSSSHWFRNSLGLAGTATAAFVAYSYLTSPGIRIENPIDPNAKPLSKVTGELGPELIQKKRSVKSPGVYVWGTNTHRVVDPDSKETVIKTPRRISYFDDQVLRDLKVGDKSGAAITDKGDLVQWGKGYSEADFKPSKTLTGKNLTSLCMSSDRILALSSDGSVYSLPIARDDQTSGRKLKEGSWVPFWSGTAGVSYRLLQPSLKLGERITSISGGLEHALLLTSSGRVFSVASSTESYPSHGQLGVPGLAWATRPQGPVDTCHEVTALKGFKIAQIATGDYHSLALSKDGSVFAFGDNSFGQLGMQFDPSLPFSDTPTMIPIERLYRGNIWFPKATRIAAGGANSFFTVDAKRIIGPGENPSAIRDLDRITADTWTCGRGIWGALGNGKWIHLQDSPTKVKPLSGLFEYDERKKTLSPIRLHEISVGTTHVSAVMDNRTHMDASPTSSLDNDNDWGFDALWWGGNEHYQLGTGKRSNLSKPSYILAPHEGSKEDKKEEARLQIMPRHKGKVGSRTVSMEQHVVCGRHISAIYSSV
ncbi:hypothetical protein N8T08_004132 [Aspergillus melleus]|uniref:Uncharacterized protein n=1 Tax=Aspergillus melleus TaxID=138277 RepID=A0ACC3B5S7_9EURO|nr:hypothetical protein N8T08_004132 [Aspergillus melleus]